MEIKEETMPSLAAPNWIHIQKQRYSVPSWWVPYGQWKRLGWQGAPPSMAPVSTKLSAARADPSGRCYGSQRSQAPFEVSTMRCKRSKVRGLWPTWLPCWEHLLVHRVQLPDNGTYTHGWMKNTHTHTTQTHTHRIHIQETIQFFYRAD